MRSALSSLGLAVACFAMGVYGWKSGIPAKWIYSVWPPAGIVFAALIVGLPRAGISSWCGVTLCFIVLGLEKAGPDESLFVTISVAMALGGVAILQGWIGACLYRRWLKHDWGLTQPTSIVRYLLIAGPVQSLVSTTLGPAIRIAAGQRQLDNNAAFLIDWWLNEVTGGIIFGTIALALFMPTAAWRSRKMTVALPLFILTVLLSLIDEIGPSELSGLPGIARRGLEFMSVMIQGLIVVLLLVLTGQAVMIRTESIRMTEDLFNETSARMLAQTSLAASQARLAQAQQIARIGSWYWDPVVGRIEWSDEMFRLLGLDPATTTPSLEAFLSVVHEDDRSMVIERMNAAIENRMTYDYDFRIRLAGGQIRTIHADAIIDRDAEGRPVMWRGTDQDVTERVAAEEERRRLDDRLRATQRWESLGQLAGGVAHDFNNLMSGVRGYASLAREQLPGESPLHDYLVPIEEASQHAASLCQQLLTLAGKGSSFHGAIDVAALLSESTDLLRMAAPKPIELRISTAKNLPIIEGDRSQLKQVLLNLVWNAVDAIGTASGTIEIRTGSCRSGGCPTQSLGHFCSTLTPGRYLWVEVRDTGCGIAEDALPRVFEPFFTTKDVGRGLGLSAVAGIVRSHGGVVCVTSRVGVGTCIRCYFTATDSDLITHTPPPVLNTPREIPYPPPRTPRSAPVVKPGWIASLE
jgi:signal transduction histidine kinase